MRNQLMNFRKDLMSFEGSCLAGKMAAILQSSLTCGFALFMHISDLLAEMGGKKKSQHLKVLSFLVIQRNESISPVFGHGLKMMTTFSWMHLKKGIG